MITAYNDKEMYHYGTPMHSGRYPWGSGENPYHHGQWFGKFMGKKKRSWQKASRRYKKRQKKMENKPSTVESKIRKPSDKRKEEIINSGDPRLVNKYKKYLTTNEINTAIKKIEADQNIAKLSKATQKSGLDKVNDVLSKGEKVIDTAEKGVKYYNFIAKVSSSLGGPKMPKIQDYDQGKIYEVKKKKAEADKAERELNKLKNIPKDIQKMQEETDRNKTKENWYKSKQSLDAVEEKYNEYFDSKEARASGKQTKENKSSGKQEKQKSTSSVSNNVDDGKDYVDQLNSFLARNDTRDEGEKYTEDLLYYLDLDKDR